jgi:ABC-2 type transport system permease protein
MLMAEPHRRGPELTGTWRLLRLAGRRDRIVLPVWLVVLLGLLAGSMASIAALYPTEADRLQYARLAATNLVARAFDGLMSGTSLGAVVMTEAFTFLALLTGVMSVQAVVRHTRLEEETGRAELVDAAVVGRHARLVAAVLVAVAANLLLAVGTTLVLVAADLPTAGSVLAGLALAGVGTTFAAVAAVAAQVSGSSRGANGLGGLVLGTAFLLRAIGDALGTVEPSGVEVVSAWPSWLSPIGWGQQVRPFGGDQTEPLLLFLGGVAALLVTAFVLASHRDHGAGLRAERPGPARASRGLTSPVGLAWRLQRGSLLGWTLGLAVLAAAFGGIADEVEELLETSDELVALLGEGAAGDVLLDHYTAFMFALLGLAVAAYLVQALLRVRTEEAGYRAEPVLATPVSRSRYLGAHVGLSAVGAVVILLVLGLVSGTVAGVVTGAWGARFWDWVLAAVVQVPAVLVLGGVVVAVLGWLPRSAVPLGWAALVASLILGQFGALFELPQPVLNVSPFTHVPPAPAEDVRALPLAVLLAVAAALTAGGFLGFRRRDLTT